MGAKQNDAGQRRTDTDDSDLQQSLEIAVLGGDTSKFVHPLIHARLQAKVAQLGG